MKTITLNEVLLTGDMGAKGADKICDAVMDNSFDANTDPISAIIVNAFVGNEYTDYEAMVIDLNYAISQLQRAQSAIYNVANS